MSDKITPRHISDLMETKKIVIRYYNGKDRLISKEEFTPVDLDEYLESFDLYRTHTNLDSPKSKERKS